MKLFDQEKEKESIFEDFGVKKLQLKHYDLLIDYSLFQKKRTVNSKFFLAPPPGATKKLGIKCAFLLE